MVETLELNNRKVKLWNESGVVTSVRIVSRVDSKEEQEDGSTRTESVRNTVFTVGGFDGVETEYWFPEDNARIEIGNRVSLLWAGAEIEPGFWRSVFRKKENREQLRDWAYLVNHESKEKWEFVTNPGNFLVNTGVIDIPSWWTISLFVQLAGILVLSYIIQPVEGSEEAHFWASVGASSFAAFGVATRFFPGWDSKWVYWSWKIKPRFKRMAEEVLADGAKREEQRGNQDLPVSTARYEEEQTAEENFPVDGEENEEYSDLEATPGQKMCLECGGVNRAGAKFCGKCGSSI